MNYKNKKHEKGCFMDARAREQSNKSKKISYFVILLFFILNSILYAGQPTPVPPGPTPQIIQSSGSSSLTVNTAAQAQTTGSSMSSMQSGSGQTITVNGLLNCPQEPYPVTEAAAAVQVQVTPGNLYEVNLLSGCISYGTDNTDNNLYGTRLRIRQAADTNGTNLTSSYSTVGYGAYNNGPVFYNCSDAQILGFYQPYNPVVITATKNYLYFTTDDVYGGYCGDNSGNETVQIFLVTATATSTLTSTPTTTPTPPPSALNLTYRPAAIMPNVINPIIRLYNYYYAPMLIGMTEIRYWKDEGSSQPEILQMVSSKIMPQGTDISGHTRAYIVKQTQGTQDSFIEISFDIQTGFLLPGQYIEVQVNVHKSDWSDYNQSNDWSYINTTDFVNNTQIPAYLSGVPILGTAPGGGAGPMSMGPLVSSTCVVPDKSFGGTGQVTKNYSAGTPYGNDFAYGIALDSSNNVITVGESYNDINFLNYMVIWRYTPNGTLDLNYGGQGFTVFSTLPNTTTWAYGVAISRMLVGGNYQDKIVASGYGCANPYFGGGTGSAMVWRYNQDGSLDTTFAGTGYVQLFTGNGVSIAWKVVVDSSNRIYVTGFSISNYSNSTMFVARYLPDGTLDQNFGSGSPGSQTGYYIDTLTSNSVGWGITLDSSDNVYVAGAEYPAGAGPEVVVWKLNSSGIPVGTFGSLGGAGIYYPIPGTMSSASGGLNPSSVGGYDIKIDSSGNIVITGITSSAIEEAMFVGRLSSSTGNPDLSFNGNGFYVDNNFVYGPSLAWTVGFDYCNRIIVQGYGCPSGPNGGLWAFLGNGYPDTTFNGGSVNTGNYTECMALENSTQSIFVAGPGMTIYKFKNTCACTTPTNTLDVTFTSTGTYTFTQTPTCTSTQPTSTMTITPTYTSTATICIASPEPTPCLLSTWGSGGIDNGLFESPWGIAVNSSEDVYFADFGNDVVDELDSSGTLLAQWGSTGSGNGQFDGPAGIALDSSGNVYVVDMLNNRIEKFNSSGTTLLAQWGSSGSGNGNFNFPFGIAVDSNGVYVADYGNNRIIEFNNSGGYIRQWNGSGTMNGLLNGPSGVAVNGSGDVYVIDYGNDRIEEFNSTGTTLLEQWGYAGNGAGMFENPYGITVDSSGDVYVADTDNNRIQEFNSAGCYIMQLGSSALFNMPFGVATDSSGDVYVADTNNSRVEKFGTCASPTYTSTPTPTYTPTATICIASPEPTPCFITAWGTPGTGNGQFNNPFGIAVDNNGNVYVSDYTNNNIQKFDSSGNFILQWGSGGNGTGQFSSPIGVAVDSSGNVYVADQGNFRIQKFDSLGNYILQWGSYGSGNGQFVYPWELAVDNSGGSSNGDVFVADNGIQNIQRFTSTGIYVTQWGSNGTGNGQFNSPEGIAIDSNENIYVLDTGNSRIEKFSNTGAYILQWGNMGSGNGQFNGPFELAVDGSGNVYVDDRNNNRIEEFNNVGCFITQWGTPGSNNGQFNDSWGMAANSSGDIYVADTGNDRIQEFGKCPSATNTITQTPTFTYTITATYTFTQTATRTNTPTWTPTNTRTSTRTVTVSRTFTPTITKTGTRTATVSHTYTPTNTPTKTRSVTYTATPTATKTGTRTATRTNTPTWTPTNTPTKTRSVTYTVTSTKSLPPTSTRTFTPTWTPTATPTYTGTPTSTATCAMSWQNVGTQGFSGGVQQATYESLYFYGDTPYVAFSDYNKSQAATVMEYTMIGDTLGWYFVGNEGFSPGAASYTSLFIDNSSGNPYVAFSDSNKNGAVTVMEYYTGKNGLGWYYVGNEGFSIWSAQDVSLFIDDSTATPIPYVAFSDSNKNGAATVMNYTTVDGVLGWNYVGTEGFSAGAAYYESLYVSNGIPYVAYQDVQNSSGATVMEYTTQNSVLGWYTVGKAAFSASAAYSESLYVYNNGTTVIPYLAYEDGSNGPATVEEYTTENSVLGWYYVGNEGFSPGNAYGESLYISNGTPYVAYVDDSAVGAEKLSVEEYTTENSVFGWYYVGSQDFTSEQVDYPSLYISNGTPYVAFQDFSTSYLGASVMEYNCPGVTGNVIKAAKANSIVKNVTTPTPEAMSANNTYNFPNPCNGPTTIRFSLSAPTDVNIGIYDINGRKVWGKSLNAASVNRGVNYVIWNLRNDAGVEVANGVYLLTIQAEGKVVRKKIAVIK